MPSPSWGQEGIAHPRVLVALTRDILVTVDPGGDPNSVFNESLNPCADFLRRSDKRNAACIAHSSITGNLYQGVKLPQFAVD
jgi:hypothetical protein